MKLYTTEDVLSLNKVQAFLTTSPNAIRHDIAAVTGTTIGTINKRLVGRIDRFKSY